MTDVWACHQLSLDQPKNETWRRLVIRTIFTGIDLFCNDLNQASTLLHKESGRKLPLEDHAFLHGKKVNKSGELKDTDYRFGEYFINTIRIYASVQGKEIRVIKGKEWNQFLGAMRMRNRLTHPKQASDLHINLSEYKEAVAGCLWAVGCLRELFAGLV